MSKHRLNSKSSGVLPVTNKKDSTVKISHSQQVTKKQFLYFKKNRHWQCFSPHIALHSVTSHHIVAAKLQNNKITTIIAMRLYATDGLYWYGGCLKLKMRFKFFLWFCTFAWDMVLVSVWECSPKEYFLLTNVIHSIDYFKRASERSIAILMHWCLQLISRRQIFYATQKWHQLPSIAPLKDVRCR